MASQVNGPQKKNRFLLSVARDAALPPSLGLLSGVLLDHLRGIPATAELPNNPVTYEEELLHDLMWSKSWCGFRKTDARCDWGMGCSAPRWQRAKVLAPFGAAAGQ